MNGDEIEEEKEREKCERNEMEENAKNGRININDES